MIRTTGIAAALLIAGCAAKKPAVVDPVQAPKEIRYQTPKQPISNVYFNFDVDTLNRSQIGALKRLVAWQSRTGAPLVCTGYADTTGTEAYNLALSLRRADAVSVHIPCRPVGAGETDGWGAEQNDRRVTILPDTTKK